MLLIKKPNGQLTLKKDDGSYTENIYYICRALQTKYDELRALPTGMYVTHITLKKIERREGEE